jgi:transcriptional regulator with AAA-type ATPase domain
MTNEIEYEGFPVFSPAMRTVFMKVAGFARQGYPLILFGPTGSGKEYLAKYYFTEYAKIAGPSAEFISINCSNLTEDLAISELFGHVKGAYTGATSDKKGLFELINKGVLFLDEIGDLLPRVQAMLLRALNPNHTHREGKRLGAEKGYSISRDLVVICATEQPGEQLRKSLLPRLGAQIYVPGMDERPEDSMSATQWFLRRAFDIRRDHRIIKEKLLTAKNTYPIKNEKELIDNFVTETSRRLHPLVQSRNWPGNYRGLRNTINEAIILACNFTSVDHFADDVVKNFCEGLRIYTEPPESETSQVAAKKEISAPGLKSNIYPTEHLSEIFPGIDDKEKIKIAEFLTAYKDIPFRRSNFGEYIGIYTNARIPQLRLRKLREENIVRSQGEGKGITYSVNPGKPAGLILPQPDFLFLRETSCTDQLLLEKCKGIRDLLPKVRGIHVSVRSIADKEKIVPCIAEVLRNRHPLYFFSFEEYDFEFLIDSVVAALKNRKEIVPSDDVFKGFTSTDIGIALVSGYLNRIIDPDLQPVLILDGTDRLKSGIRQQTLVTLIRSWYFFKFILIGEKLESYLDRTDMLEYSV